MAFLERDGGGRGIQIPFGQVRGEIDIFVLASVADLVDEMIDCGPIDTNWVRLGHPPVLALRIAHEHQLLGLRPEAFDLHAVNIAAGHRVGWLVETGNNVVDVPAAGWSEPEDHAEGGEHDNERS